MSRRRCVLLVVCLWAVGLVGLLGPGPPTARSAAVPLSISVAGNHFVNGAGQTVRLLGVDREGTEYACVSGTGYSVGPEDASDAAAIAAWHTNAVRIPLNEDCWLGINGLPASGTAAGYRQAIENYVAALNADGIYAILDLQWNAPGTIPANGLRTMPDSHALAFWTSVATTFAHNPAVLFDAFNEPHSVTWACWRDGGCQVPDAVDGATPDPTQTYPAVGMQTIIDTIRATGARQPILLSGLNHGNDLTGWLANMPHDPDGQLAAGFHVYQPNACATTTCWNTTVAPVAAVVPVTMLEFSEQDCAQTWDDSLMSWDDTHGIGYLGWGWFILYVYHCQNLYLINDWSGTPSVPNGVALKDHLAALWTAAGGPATPAGATPTPTSTPPSPTPTLRLAWSRLTPKALLVRLRSSQRVTGRVSAITATSSAMSAGRHHRPRKGTALTTRRFHLPARRWRVITAPLPARARRLLANHHSVRARVTITATTPAGPTTTIVREVSVTRRRRLGSHKRRLRS